MTPGEDEESRDSLLMTSAAWRMAAALVLVALVWLGVAWALAGNP
jgi:hypothetical protein